MANFHFIAGYYSGYDKRPISILVNIDQIVTILSDSEDSKITRIELTNKRTLVVERPIEEVVVELREYYKKTTI
jgi:hypothetical protein